MIILIRLRLSWLNEFVRTAVLIIKRIETTVLIKREAKRPSWLFRTSKRPSWLFWNYDGRFDFSLRNRVCREVVATKKDAEKPWAHYRCPHGRTITASSFSFKSSDKGTTPLVRNCILLYCTCVSYFLAPTLRLSCCVPVRKCPSFYSLGVRAAGLRRGVRRINSIRNLVTIEMSNSKYDEQ